MTTRYFCRTCGSLLLEDPAVLSLEQAEKILEKRIKCRCSSCGSRLSFSEREVSVSGQGRWPSKFEKNGSVRKDKPASTPIPDMEV